MANHFLQMQFAIKSLPLQPLLLWRPLPQSLLQDQNQAASEPLLVVCLLCQDYLLAQPLASHILFLPVKQKGESGRQGQEEKRRDSGKKKELGRNGSPPGPQPPRLQALLTCREQREKGRFQVHLLPAQAHLT